MAAESGEGHDEFAGGDARQVKALLLLRAIHQYALRTDSDIPRRALGRAVIPRAERRQPSDHASQAMDNPRAAWRYPSVYLVRKILNNPL
jgi:hypothetical protein